jgi:hypothetical protein
MEMVSSFRNVLFFCVFLEYRMMDKVKKPSNPECYTPESFFEVSVKVKIGRAHV